MPTQDEAMVALANIDANIPDDGGAAGAQALPDLGQICPIYNSIRGDLEKAVQFLEVLPISQAKAIAKALKMLMTIANLACPVVP